MAKLHAYVLAQNAARDVGRIRSNLSPALRRALIRLGPRLERIYSAVAPHNTGKLASEIRSEFRTPEQIEVVSPVKSAEGFPYTGVTRFGHRSAFIYPRTARALRFQIGGRTIFATRVRGYHPARDWADSGLPLARREVIAAGREMAASL